MVVRSSIEMRTVRIRVISNAMGVTITIRPYRSGDADALANVFYGAVRMIACRDYTEDQLRVWAPDAIDLDEFRQARAATATWVAASGSELVGFSDLGSDGHIGMLYVRPDFQRRGVARALLSHIESVARERGLDRLYTEASITARPAFTALGFDMLAERTVTRRGVELTNYGMEKRLP